MSDVKESPRVDVVEPVVGHVVDRIGRHARPVLDPEDAFGARRPTSALR